MPIVSSDVKYYLSGGASNVNPNISLGGYISTVQFVDNSLDNLFGDASGPETISGSTKYRCLYVKNGNGTLPMQRTSFFIKTNSLAASNTINIGLGTSGLNGTEQAILFDYNAPVGITFLAPSNRATGLNIGSIPPGQTYPIWFQSILTGPAASFTGNTFLWEVDCDSGT